MEKIILISNNFNTVKLEIIFQLYIYKFECGCSNVRSTNAFAR